MPVRPVVTVAARPGGADAKDPSIGLQELRSTICEMTVGENGVPRRTTDGTFRFAVDHCHRRREQEMR